MTLLLPLTTTTLLIHETNDFSSIVFSQARGLHENRTIRPQGPVCQQIL